MTDGYGLFLIISPTGSKSWRFNYYRPITKKRAKISLGLYPAITLSKARELREQYRQLLANKIDPQEYINSMNYCNYNDKTIHFFAISTQWKQKKVSEIKSVTLKKPMENARKICISIFRR